MQTVAQVNAAIDTVDTAHYFEVNRRLPLVPIVNQSSLDATPARRSTLLEKLMIAIHYLVWSGTQATGIVPIDLFCHWIWGENKPANWRPQLGRLISKAESATQNEGQNMFRIDFGGRGKRVIEFAIAPNFLGGLRHAMSQGDNTVRILSKSVNEHSKVSSTRLYELKQSDANYATYSNSTMREIVFDRRKTRRDTTLAAMRQAGTVRMHFVPLLLSVRPSDRNAAQLAALLIGEQSRNYSVNNGEIRPFSKGPDIVCPGLSPEITYAAFAANGKNRAGRGIESNRTGRGYKIGTWAKRAHDGEILSFLQHVRLHSPTLGLIVIGIDELNTIYSVNDLLIAGERILEKVHLRIYTPVGYMQRWADMANWKPWLDDLSADQRASQEQSVGDLPVLRAIAKQQGIRETARGLSAAELKIDYSDLSKILSGRCKTSQHRMDVIRRYLLGNRPQTGESCVDLFEGSVSKLDWAIAYNRLGWSTLPVIPGERKTYFKWTPYQTSLPTENEVKRWFGVQYPDANIGCVLGPISGLFVVDIDTEDALNVLIDRLGGEPAAPFVLSGSYDPNIRWWKRHYFFKYPVGIDTKSKFTPWDPGLEFRGTNGLIYLPPTISHKTGQQYAWAVGATIWQIELPEVPEPILSELRGANKSNVEIKTTAISNAVSSRNQVGGNVLKVRKETVAFLQGKFVSADGEWNNRLFAAAVDLRNRDVTQERAQTLILKGAGCRSEKDRQLAIATINSAYSRPQRAR